ncbi:MAG: T9SS type A sorting domain-containing protein [Weeksellaceae bacterium]|nr:T9SS type A sorting domain-containing protein [Weeksellaceae bacterium]
MKTLFISLFFCCFGTLLAQLPYTFTHSQEEYATLQNANELTDGTIWLELEDVVDLGFEFELFGTTLTSIEMSGLIGNGMLYSFDAGLEEYDVLVPFGTVLVDAALSASGDNDGQPNGLSHVRYVIEGEVGNRIAKFEFENLGLYYEIYLNAINEIDADISTTNFQVWLYEADNAIEYRYGETEIVNAQFAFGGAVGPFVGMMPDFYVLDGVGVFSPNTLWLEGMPDDPELVSAGNVRFLSHSPANGTVYRFVPNGLATDEVVVSKSVVYPNPVIDQFTIQGVELHEIRSVDCINMAGVNVRNWEAAPSYDMRGLSNGVYFIMVHTMSGKRITHKVLKK